MYQRKRSLSIGWNVGLIKQYHIGMFNLKLIEMIESQDI